MPQLHIFDTLKREKCPLVPQDGKTIHMYCCGPTVYNYAHIGNLRTYVFEDLLRRTIKFFGMGVKHALNLTDVDDKTIAGAIKENVTLDEYTKTYKEAFFEDLKTLNVERAEIYPEATQHVKQMIAIISKLIEKGFAYQGSDGNVFYHIAKFEKYGALSHLDLSSLRQGASERTSNDEYDKENISDFVLWKAYDEKRDGPHVWESPWGRGRPGWHIECSAMAIEHLGETIDLHVGGEDNIFPHHDNEIAQSEACTSKVFSKHWMHSAHLIVDGRKMSKSAGNFYTLRDLLDKGYTGPEVRMLLVQTHYRSQLNFTMEGLIGARNALERLGAFVERLKAVSGKEKGLAQPIVDHAMEHFTTALADDLNISSALSSLFDLIRQVNSLIDEENISAKEAAFVLKNVEEMDKVLGIVPFKSATIDIPEEILHALEERNRARIEKDWVLADQMRDKIAEAGFVIEDSPSGPKLKKK